MHLYDIERFAKMLIRRLVNLNRFMNKYYWYASMLFVSQWQLNIYIYALCLPVVNYCAKLKAKCKLMLETNDQLVANVQQMERKIQNDARGARNIQLHFQVGDYF